MNRQRLLFYTGLAVSAAFIVFAAAKMDLRAAFSAMMDIHTVWLVPLAALFLLQFYLRALRMTYITEPLKAVPLGTLFSSIAIGFMGNFVLPMRAGELLRVYVVARLENLSVGGVVATVVAERLFDMLSVLAIVVLTLMVAHPAGVAPETWGKMKGAGMGLAVAGCVAAVLFYSLSKKDSAVSRLLAGLIARLPEKTAERSTRIVGSFRTGLQVFGADRHLAATVIHSVTLWVSVVAFFLVALPLFGLPLSFEVGLMVTVMVLIGVAIPSSPGFVGPYHAAIVFALGLYGVDGDRALGIAIFLHAFSFLGTMGLGLYCVWREKLGFADLRRSAEASR